jgi:hypothetical protein
VVLDVTAKDSTGRQVFKHQREWKEIGVDLKGDQRAKAWEIKNTIDNSLQPRRTYTDTLLIPFPEGAKEGEVEVRLIYFLDPARPQVVERVVKKVNFPR